MLPHAAGRAGRSLGAKVLLILTVLSIVLAVSTVGVALERKRRAAEDLTQALFDLRAQTRGQSALRAEIATLEGRMAALTALRTDQPLTVEVLEAVTALLPDDSWLTSLRIEDGEVDLSGHAAQAAELIGLFEAAPQFTQVRFRDPVVQAGTTGLETFSIAMVLTAARHEEAAP